MHWINWLFANAFPRVHQRRFFRSICLWLGVLLTRTGAKHANTSPKPVQPDRPRRRASGAYECERSAEMKRAANCAYATRSLRDFHAWLKRERQTEKDLLFAGRGIGAAAIRSASPSFGRCIRSRRQFRGNRLCVESSDVAAQYRFLPRPLPVCNPKWAMLCVQ